MSLSKPAAMSMPPVSSLLNFPLCARAVLRPAMVGGRRIPLSEATPAKMTSFVIYLRDWRQGPVLGVRRLNLAEVPEQTRMSEPKINVMFAAAAAAILSANVALAATASDDRSYLPPPELRAQGKPSAAPEALPTKRRLRSAVYRRSPGQIHPSFAPWRPHRWHALRQARRDFGHRHIGRFYAHQHSRRFYAHYRARRAYAWRGFFPGFFFGLFP